MIYQKHLSGFLAFPVFGVRLKLQNLRFFPAYFVTFFLRVTPRNSDVLETVAIPESFLKLNIHCVGL
jgi:hypothetical protein